MKMISELFIIQKIWFNFVSFLTEQSLVVTLQMFTEIYGVPVGFFCDTYQWKRAVRITEKPYTPQRERLCML